MAVPRTRRRTTTSTIGTHRTGSPTFSSRTLAVIQAETNAEGSYMHPRAVRKERQARSDAKNPNDDLLHGALGVRIAELNNSAILLLTRCARSSALTLVAGGGRITFQVAKMRRSWEGPAFGVREKDFGNETMAPLQNAPAAPVVGRRGPDLPARSAGVV